MARTVKDAKLDTRAARLRLATRHAPYWRGIEPGLHLGYRRRSPAGYWCARRYVGEQSYETVTLGVADDMSDADGAATLTFAQAQEAARKWWVAAQRREAGLEPVDSGPYTIAHALRDYFSARERKGSKGVAKDRSYANTRILPDLGKIEVSKLTTAKLRRWHEDLATRDKLVRTKRQAKERQTKVVDFADPETVRARRATANRVLTILKAALNHAFHEHHAASDEVWRKVKPFREVETAIVRYLNNAEAKRLVSACPVDFRRLVQAALLSGARYSELTQMRVADFNPDAGTVAVRKSKSGKTRHIVLTEEGQRLISSLVAGRNGIDLIFVRSNGQAWKASEQQRPLAEASKRAGIEPAVTFHILRHSHASALAMKRVPIEVIAEQLGHADTRVTRRHYAHLAPSYIADTIRAGLGDLGVVDNSHISAMSGQKR